MKARILPGLLLVLGLPALLPAAATLEGRVALPKPRAAPVMNKRYEIVSQAGVLSTNPPVAVVYLEGNFPADAAPAVRQVSQKDMTFLPMLLPIRTGDRVEFPNEDDTYHNIFSYSAAKRFDLGRYPPAEKPVPSVLFDTPGLVVLRCDIHEHMRGLILVLSTPHFGQTDAGGRYRLAGLPAGRFTVKAWVDSHTTLSREIDLPENGTVTLDFP